MFRGLQFLLVSSAAGIDRALSIVTPTKQVRKATVTVKR